ncbi:hypothetical protein [Streptomyces vietnamensis]|uniref:Leucine-binding protein domain-containing protein n=1 Tax=Streptomyces vietnamensis TaxID=362257 RepID=A0A0B5I6B6_9ACTN|nr:hypothetical protein [Streptomyces vietnamensis]AJF63804.1 hypothetical protein SVTN_04515 [Streptomyces vietnamensis]
MTLPNGPLTRSLLIVVVLACLGAVGFWVLTPDDSCAPGVYKREKECVGVTDGSFVFTPALRQVSERIKAENDSLADKPAATIALMIPMVSQAAAERREFVEQVQGAYLAQWKANHEANNKQPPIRLLLANPGPSYRHWRAVSDQLVSAAADPKQNLRAVVGINISIPETEQAIRYLTKEKGIPVVAGPMTADDIMNTAAQPQRYPGLARIAPSNTDQANALAAYGAAIKPEKSLVVEDIREGDNYLSSLRKTFERLARNAPIAPETFRSPPDFNDESNLANDFHQMVPDICASPATTIYFAGRPVQLRQFLIELGDRTCTKHYTVITGSHASTLMVDEKFADKWDVLNKGSGITVRYAALAHPDAWGEKSTEATGGSRTAMKGLSELLRAGDSTTPDAIGPAGLGDGRIIITYDAVTTAITGIRNETTKTVTMPSLRNVTDSWLRLKGTSRVEGASGWICLDQYGNPNNKAVSIVHLDPATKTAVFDGVAWPLGHAPDPNCSIAN